jgi:hypothetical protein
MVDYLMSGLAIFSLKFPSLLQFDEHMNEQLIKDNLKNLFQVEQAPCDTQLRTKLDTIDPKLLRKPFKAIVAAVQRGKALEAYKYINDTYLLAIDGTGMFYSNEVHCENCCEKQHIDGTISYYHNMLCGAIVHPKLKTVLPVAPEPILKQDGATKNDCELNAVKRFLLAFRQEHPHLAVTIVEDGLYGNGPHIKMAQELKMHYLIMVKEKDHGYLFDAARNGNSNSYEETGEDGTQHKFSYINGVSLNYTHYQLLVNFFAYEKIKTDGSRQYFSWVTDHHITDNNIMILMRGGRARWHIENETFNTLKNQGYNFEHNYGHGKKNLSTIFAMLMLLAFLIDQVQATCCTLFTRAFKAQIRKKYMWEHIRNLFEMLLLNSWEDLYNILIFGVTRAIPNTS